jgi:hypothetical protein
LLNTNDRSKGERDKNSTAVHSLIPQPLDLSVFSQKCQPLVRKLLQFWHSLPIFALLSVVQILVEGFYNTVSFVHAFDLCHLISAKQRKVQNLLTHWNSFEHTQTLLFVS